MTDQTSATEAGRRLLAKEDADVPYGGASVADILAIEAEARASLDVDVLRDAMYQARADGLIYDGITNADEAAIYAREYDAILAEHKP